MELQVANAIELLERTPGTLNSLLRGVSDGWTRSTEGPETWSAFDVVGHLIHGERTDWMPRMRIVLEEGERRTFEPFDRFAQFQTSQGKTLEQLLDEFAALRAENVAALKALNLSPEQFELKGKHPTLGTVTLRNLLATWVVHDLNHIGQIVRVMAKQYAGEGGPFAAFLSILQWKYVNSC